MAIVANKADPADPVDKSYTSSRFAVTPSDSAPQPTVIQALYVGVAGNVAMKRGNETPVVVPFAAGGPYLVGGVTHIMATNTTATGIIGLADGALI